MLRGCYRAKKLLVYVILALVLAALVRRYVPREREARYLAARGPSRGKGMPAGPVLAQRLQTWPWRLTTNVYCDGHFILYERDFARLRHVLLDANLSRGPAGGEDVRAVLNRSEDSEYLNLLPGFFSLSCGQPALPTSPIFRGKNHLNSYLAALFTNASDLQLPAQSPLTGRTTFVVTRYEYANNCHSMTYFYNAFLTMRFLRLDPDHVHVLVVDAHPAAPTYDQVWLTLFGEFTRVGSLRGRAPTVVPDMVWLLMGYHAPLIQDRFAGAPQLEEFRTFFLQRHAIKDDRELDCDKVHVTFIWRRNYVAHPRNPSGTVSRRISNEQELVTALERRFPQVSVIGVQLENLSMAEQLHIVAHTDLLIGMHGAGLMHVLFLPSHAGLIEMFPTYWSPANMHFRKISEWRGLQYLSWVNRDYRLEVAKQSTYIPPDVLLKLVQNAFSRMRCIPNT